MSAFSFAKGLLVAAVFLQIVGTALGADEPATPGQSEPRQGSPEAGAEIAEEAPTHRDFMTIITDDPLVKDEFSLPAISYLSQNGEPGGPGPVQEWTATAEFQKRITERFGIGVEYGLTAQNTVHDRTRSGFENLVIFAKYQAYENANHELLVSLGLVREFGSTGTQRIGVAQYGSTTPTIFLGKGFGDLTNKWLRPVGMTANFGFAVSDRELSFSQVTNPLTGGTGQVSNNGMENRWVGGVSLQWSGPYVRERGIDLHVPEFVKRLTPLVELAWSSPASSPSNVGPQYLLGSGVFYSGTWFELGVEALIPLNRATGRGIGVVAQFNVPLEDLLPNSLGKPLLN